MMSAAYHFQNREIVLCELLQENTLLRTPKFTMCFKT